jgi:hypothetical protein
MTISIYDVDNIDQFNHPIPKGVPANLLAEFDSTYCVGLVCNGTPIGEFLDVNEDGYDVGRFRAYTIVDSGDGTPPLYFCEDCICFLMELAPHLIAPVTT